MTIEELKKEKQNLEQDILNLICSFEVKTQVTVTEIKLTHFQSFGRANKATGGVDIPLIIH